MPDTGTSNVGKWHHRYKNLRERKPYAATKTYEMGAEFLAPLPVEDWGCGSGWFGGVYEGRGAYRGIDGTASPFCDAVVDLVTYRSDPPMPAVFMRHILEHNYEWEAVLDNALASFSQRMFLVLFTPFSETGQVEELKWWPTFKVPDLSFPEQAIADHITAAGATFEMETVRTHAQYNLEHCYRIQR